MPKLDTLVKLVEPSLYPSSSGDNTNFPSIADFVRSVQASRTELVNRLRLLGAFELDGKVRTPEKLLLAEHTKALLETIISQNWVTRGSAEHESSIEVDEALCLSTLQTSSFPADPVLVQCVLHSLGARIDESNSKKDSDSGGDIRSSDSDNEYHLPSFTSPAKWRLDMSKVKIASARMLLQEESIKSNTASTASGGMSLADFLLEWPLRTPGMRLQDEVSETDLALLRGLAVLADDNKLHYVPADTMQNIDAKVLQQGLFICSSSRECFICPTSLSFFAQARLASLFNVKSSYTAEELQPYLEGLWGPGAATAVKTMQELLAPLARFVSATKTYSAK